MKHCCKGVGRSKTSCSYQDSDLYNIFREKQTQSAATLTLQEALAAGMWLKTAASSFPQQQQPEHSRQLQGTVQWTGERPRMFPLENISANYPRF